MGEDVTDSNPPIEAGQILLDKAKDAECLFVDVDDTTRLQIKDPTKMSKFGEVTVALYQGATINLVSLDPSKVFALGIPSSDNLWDSNGYILNSQGQILNFNEDIKISLDAGSITLRHNAISLSIGTAGLAKGFVVNVLNPDGSSTSRLVYNLTGILSGIANPNNDDEAANKGYVDSEIQKSIISWQNF